MRKIFYLLLTSLTTSSLFAQTPGGVSGSVLWLKGNTGASPTTWTDNSTFLNHFTSPGGNQPVLTTNVFNFNSAMGFDGTSSYMSKLTPSGFPAGNSDRSIFVVANAAATGGFRWIFVYGSPFSGSDVTCQMGNSGGNLVNAYFGSSADINSSNYWDAAGNSNGALASFTLNSNLETQYDRGSLLNSQTVTATLLATSLNGVIGALTPAPQEVWNGNIGEVIMFPTALTNADRNRVESYLALKYGFTLGAGTAVNYVASDNTTVFWTGSIPFQHDVFGIGTDNGTALTQIKSNSMNSGNGDGTGQNAKGNLVLSTGTALADKQFLMIGNNAGALTEHTIATGEGNVLTVGSKRVLRNWKVQNTGTVGAVGLSFDTTGLTLSGGSVLSNFRLMLDTDGDGDFTTGASSFYIASSATGNQLNFTGVTLTNNTVFTLITQTASLLPAIWQGFTVTLDKTKALLVWKTSDEVNVDHYTVEYSTDGISYLPLGTVAAKNGAGINTYSISQDNLPGGTRYYHIKRFDKDGRIQISDIKSIRVGTQNSLLLKSNPVTKGKLELNIDVDQNQNAIIRILNINGKILAQQNTGLSNGVNAVSTNISGLSAGVYFLQVQLGTQIINKKFVRF
jgi:Secretion system C-terminal sorting domain